MGNTLNQGLQEKSHTILKNRGAEFTVIIFVIVTAEFNDESNN
jgi:hypothetical protein